MREKAVNHSLDSEIGTDVTVVVGHVLLQNMVIISLCVCVCVCGERDIPP